MNRKEAQALVTMGMAMYPATYAPPAQLEYMISIWADGLKDVPAPDAIEAFRATAKCTPDRFPSLPKVQETLDAMRRNRPDPEKEFRDMHGGKSREEWDAMIAFENSEEGKRVRAMRQRQFEEMKARWKAERITKAR